MTRRAVVVGSGIAGISSAIGLHRAGWEVTVLERAAERRRGGYFMGLFSAGQSAARRLGALERMHLRTPPTNTTWEIDRIGRRRPGIGFLEHPGSPEAVLRGDVEAALHASLPDEVELRYASSPVAIRDLGHRVDVDIRTGGTTTTESVNLVVGADGVRSTTRRLVFGPDQEFHRSLGTAICAFQLHEPVEGFHPLEGFIQSEPRRSLWVFPIAGETPTVLFSYRPRGAVARELDKRPADAVRQVFGEAPGTIVEAVLAQLEDSEVALWDEATQVVMPSWHRGRVVLAGDAAWCLTLYSGMGASMGIVGGELLGESLRADADVDSALIRWEGSLRPYVDYHQREATAKSRYFTPTGPIDNWFRERFVSLATRRSRQPAFLTRKAHEMAAFDLVADSRPRAAS